MGQKFDLYRTVAGVPVERRTRWDMVAGGVDAAAAAGASSADFFLTFACQHTKHHFKNHALRESFNLGLSFLLSTCAQRTTLLRVRRSRTRACAVALLPVSLVLFRAILILSKYDRWLIAIICTAAHLACRPLLESFQTNSYFLHLI